MKTQNADSTAPDTQVKPETGAEPGPNGDDATGTAEELNLNDLVDYHPVPPRRVLTISVEYRCLGRGRPLPYSLDEDTKC